MSDLTGGCACGAVRFTARGAPRFSIICQCRSCQRASGSGNAAQVAVDAGGFQATGNVSEFARLTASGNTVTKRFCPACGCPLWQSTTRADDMIMILAGALDDPAPIEPKYLVCHEEAQPWDYSRLPDTGE